MGMFSAITFTGICGNAYLAGWSVLIIFWTNALMFFIQGWLFAPKFRRTRADTPQDVIRLRFGRPLEQFLSYFGTMSSFIWGGTFLLSLATFMSVVFGLPVWALILIVGGVVIFYSVSGGSWSVQITDSLQAVLLIPVTIAFAVICLYHVGGIGGLFEMIEAKGLTADFALAKPDNFQYKTPIPIEKGMFTGLWVIAMMFNSLIQAAHLNNANRYLSLRDERGAQKAAYLAGFLMLVGSLVWFIPPMVGRLYFSADIVALEGLNNQSDAAYAMTAMKLLPPGLLGLIVVSMAAATMSSMDSYLTGVAATIVKNMYLPLMGKLKRKTPEGMKLVRFTQITSLVLGLWCVAMAFILQRVSGSGGIFGIMMTVTSLIAAPVSIPVVLSIFFKRIPIFGFYASMGCGFATSLTIMIWQNQTGDVVPWHAKIFIMFGITIVPALISILFWNKTSEADKARVDHFFKEINRPIEAENETGANISNSLTGTVGGYVLVSALAISLMVFFARNTVDVVAVLSITAFLLVIGFVMRKLGKSSA